MTALPSLQVAPPPSAAAAPPAAAPASEANAFGALLAQQPTAASERPSPRRASAAADDELSPATPDGQLAIFVALAPTVQPAAPISPETALSAAGQAASEVAAPPLAGAGLPPEPDQQFQALEAAAPSQDQDLQAFAERAAAALQQGADAAAATHGAQAEAETQLQQQAAAAQTGEQARSQSLATHQAAQAQVTQAQAAQAQVTQAQAAQAQVTQAQAAQVQALRTFQAQALQTAQASGDPTPEAFAAALREAGAASDANALDHGLAPSDPSQSAAREASPAKSTPNLPGPIPPALQATAPGPQGGAPPSPLGELAGDAGEPSGEFLLQTSATPPAPPSTIAQSASIPAASAARPQPNLPDIARGIAQRTLDGGRQFELQLHPVELGRIDVRIEIGKDNSVSASLTADDPRTLVDLARNARELERSLQQAGLQLAHNGLSFDLSRRDPGQQQGGEGRSRPRAGEAFALQLDGADATAASVLGPAARFANARINLFA